MNPKGASPSPNPPANIYLMFLEALETSLEKSSDVLGEPQTLKTTRFQQQIKAAFPLFVVRAFRPLPLGAHVSGTILRGTNRQ